MFWNFVACEFCGAFRCNGGSCGLLRHVWRENKGNADFFPECFIGHRKGTAFGHGIQRRGYPFDFGRIDIYPTPNDDVL